jgi:hypothetical protein
MKKTLLIAAAAALSMSCTGRAQQGSERSTENLPTIKVSDFDQRVNDYVKLRDKLDGGAAALRETKDAAKIKAAQETLAERIRAVRADAQPGAIFTPEIKRQFRALLRPELKGKDGAETKEIIEEENPENVYLKVNAKYPEGEPVTTVPPNVLLTLPKLPEGLEFRFVGRHLILRDDRANLIVDFIPNALPPAAGGSK